MDFFESQARAHRNTKWLLAYFVLAVLGIIAVLQVVIAIGLGESPADWRLLGMISGGVIVVVLLGALYRIAELARGGSVVAELMGGRQVDPHSTDLAESRLRNVVEEMAIASGVPVPEIYVLDEEEGINAFAAGNTPGDAAVAVTRGTLDRLSRDELQGVVAHEFSHILNGDMRLNIRLMGALNGILLLAILGRILFRTGFWTGGRVRTSRDGASSGAQMGLFGIGIALFLVGSIGVFFARLIKAAVSRQREFLADASAVQFTRNPDGIAGALYKIGETTSQLATPRADEASHMFFGNGLKQPLMSWFATHPPIEERIRAVSPNFDPASVSSAKPPGDRISVAGATQNRAEPAPETADWTSHAGALGSPQLAAALGLLAGLPEFTRAAAREPSGSMALIYSLLLSADSATRERQLAAIHVAAPERAEIERDLARRGQIAEEDWLSTVDLCLPALRKLSQKQYEAFRGNVKILIEADGEVDLFEYVLQKALVHHLDAFFTNDRGPAIRYRSLIPLLPDCVTVLSALAWFDSEDAAARDAAYAAGVEALMVSRDSYPMTRLPKCDLGAVDQSLDRMAQADPATKKKILVACGRVVTHDGVIAPRQGALLRAIADTLGCPIPPFATGRSS